eukprot:5859561-Prymnesium_polylepis.1
MFQIPRNAIEQKVTKLQGSKPRVPERVFKAVDLHLRVGMQKGSRFGASCHALSPGFEASRLVEAASRP